MHFLNSFNNLRLDIVGIIAVLGEGSVTRNAQVSALAWFSIIPRLLPAPQALLENERKSRLPTQQGTVVGAYSGNVKHELNFFVQPLHCKPLEKYEVELVEVARAPDTQGARSFGCRPFSWLLFLSLLGCAMSLALTVLSVVWQDDFALLATVLLSFLSTAVGLGTHWKLDFKEPKLEYARQARQDDIPRSDVVIYYPYGAIRIVRCEESIARLYFETESCDYTVSETPYRTIASLATVMLMAAVVSLANASASLQAAFAAAYVIWSFLYWICSALNPYYRRWDNSYVVSPISYRPLHVDEGPKEKAKGTAPTRPAALGERVKLICHDVYDRWKTHRFLMQPDLVQAFETTKRVAPEARNFPAALWTAIALTQTTQWLNEGTHIAPVNDAWKEWIQKAGDKIKEAEQQTSTEAFERIEPRHAQPLRDRKGTAVNLVGPERRIVIPDWTYQQELTAILRKHKPASRKRLNLDEDTVGVRRVGTDLRST